MNQNTLSIFDHVICGVDRALRTLSPNTVDAGRSSPSKTKSNSELSEKERKHAAGLMRVNHAGEVCAQALYQGQAIGTKLPGIRAEMEHAADEEIDHLAWCEERITDLGSHTSLLNPVWYGMSFGIGLAAGKISDKISLGFVAATEEQVCIHLQDHLGSLPEGDKKSRAVVELMLEDEAKHAHTALEAGGAEFPAPVKAGMSLVSKAMTFSSYRI